MRYVFELLQPRIDVCHVSIDGSVQIQKRVRPSDERTTNSTMVVRYWSCVGDHAQPSVTSSESHQSIVIDMDPVRPLPLASTIDNTARRSSLDPKLWFFFCLFFMGACDLPPYRRLDGVATQRERNQGRDGPACGKGQQNQTSNFKKCAGYCLSSTYLNIVGIKRSNMWFFREFCCCDRHV